MVPPRLASLLALSALWGAQAACTTTQCANPDFGDAECREQAAAELARVRTTDGVQACFQAPGADVDAACATLGRMELTTTGSVHARVATLGAFQVRVDPGPEPGRLGLELANIDPRIPALQGEVDRRGLSRMLELDLGEEPVVVSGALPAELCEGTWRLAAAGDVQTNPVQLRRILAAMQEAEAGEEPLLGLLLLGDLSEHSLLDELDQVDEILQGSPVPVAVTTGNHDVYASGDGAFTRTFGPGTYAFDLCGARIAMLDTGDGALAPSVVGRFPELFTGEDTDFLVAGMHYPPDAGITSAGFIAEDQAHLLMADLAARGADQVLAGHVHRRFASTDTIVPQTVVGTLGADQGAVEPDYGYARLSFGDELGVCFVPVPAPNSTGNTQGHEPENCPK